MQKSIWIKLMFLFLWAVFSAFFTACAGNSTNPPQEPEPSSEIEDTIQLTAPVIDLDYDNGVTWASIANAKGYIVNVNGTDFDIQTGTYFEELPEAGTYTIKIKALAVSEAYLDSAWSNELTYTVKPFFEVEKFQSVAYKIVGSDKVTEGADYNFSVSVNTTLYDGDYTVWVNGKQVSVSDGVYTVPNVQEKLSIEVKGLTIKELNVTVVSDNHVSFVGEPKVIIMTDYTFTATPDDDYYVVVYVNGAELMPTNNGSYVVKKVTESLEISFWAFESTVAVTYSEMAGVTFNGPSRAEVFEDYTFQLQTTKSGYIVYCNNILVNANSDGTYTVKNVEPEKALDFKFVNYGESASLIPTTYNGDNAVMCNVPQAHAEEGHAGVTGTKLISMNGQTEFISVSTMRLRSGENVIAKFMTTNNVMPEWQSKYEVNYITYNLTDTITGDKLTVSVRSTWFVDGFENDGNRVPNAYVAIWINDKFIALSHDGYLSNFSNVTMNHESAWKKIPEIKFNTTTGTISYCDRNVLDHEDLIGFGVSNPLSVSIELNVKEAGYGVVIDTLCNQSLKTELPANAVYVTYTALGGVSFNGDSTATIGEDYTFTASVIGDYDLVVYCNGIKLTANGNGTYTVKNVSQALHFTFDKISDIAAITKGESEAYTILGAETVKKGETYTFSVAVNEEQYKGEYAVLVNGEVITATAGVYSVPNVQDDLFITVKGLFKVSSGTGSVASNVPQEHAEEGYAGITGTRLISTDANSVTFTYGSTVKLDEGDNVIAKFMTTNTVNASGFNNLDVNYVKYTLTDTVTGKSITIRIDSIPFHDDGNYPNAYVVIFIDGVFKDLINDEYYSNYANVTMNSDWAFKLVPEIRLNTNKGSISYCNKTDIYVNGDALCGFGTTNPLSVSIELNVKQAGYGIVLDALCNESL